MSEEKTLSNENAGTQSSNSDNGNITSTATLIERADGVAKRMEEANKKAEELLKRQEEIAARIMLGGRSEAGTKQKSAEELDQEKVDAEIQKRMARFR